MNHQIRSHFSRALQRWRGEAVVDRQKHAGLVRDVRQRSNVAKLCQWVGRRLGEEQPRFRSNGRTPSRNVGLRHKTRLHPKTCQFTPDELHGGAEHRL